MPDDSSQLDELCTVLLAESSSPNQLSDALNRFVQICAKVGGVTPDPAFDAWAGDSFLADGVAIAPQAAAHCAHDYRRTVVFIRGIYAAIAQAKHQFPGETLQVLYAGCGPYATLLLPILKRFAPEKLDISLLDIHQPSLDSINKLLQHFDLIHYKVKTLRADACNYQHPRPLHIVISETMQKSLEQEPQFAITARLAPQLREGGIFIPGNIAVRLCLTQLNNDHPSTISSDGYLNGIKPGALDHYELGSVLELTPDTATELSQAAIFHEDRGKWELPPVAVEIPKMNNPAELSAAFFTRIQVYAGHWLNDFDAQITLPQCCTDLSPLLAGECWEISYELGGYPRFNPRRIGAGREQAC